MQDFIIKFIEQYGYLSIFLLILLENVFPPIPSEVILGFGGFMTTCSDMKIPYVIVASTAGSVVGAIILYFLGYLLDAKGVEKIVSRWGNILHIKMEDVGKADAWLNRFGYFAVFICRMVPIIRSLISFPAGMARMKFSYFLLLTTAGTLIWNTFLVWGGALLGKSWNRIIEYINVYSSIACAIFGIFLILFIIKKHKF